MGRVIVVGSINTDLVVTVPRLPAPGETVSGGDAQRFQGGKGANQAVAAARLGAQVVLVGAVGKDEFGRAALDALGQEGIDPRFVGEVDRPTGLALILIDREGQNNIAVAPGANGSLDASSVKAALLELGMDKGDVVLACGEVPAAAVQAAFVEARRVGARTILNPAPPDDLVDATMSLADVLTPNESELRLLTGIVRTTSTADVTTAARILLAKVESDSCIVTRGALGALLVTAAGSEREVAAPLVEALDTTGAGDTFNGALAAEMAGGATAAEAIDLAVRAASASTRRLGARTGMPRREELEQREVSPVPRSSGSSASAS